MRKFTLVLFALLILLAGMATAGPEPGSFTSDSTNDLFEGPQDYYLEPDEFSKLESTSVFLQLDTPNNFPSYDRFQLGTGIWITDSLFASGYYQGYTLLNNSQDQNTDTVLLTDSTGAIVGKQETTNTSLDDQNETWTNPQLLGGFALGDMQIGVSDAFAWYDGENIRTADPINGYNVATSSVTEVVRNGEVVSRTGTEYDPAGFQKDNRVGNNLEAGILMPLGEMTLTGELGINFDVHNNSNYAASESYTQDFTTATSYPALTPPATFAGVESATELTSVTSYQFRRANYYDSRFDLDPELDAAIEMPLQFMGYDGMFEGSLGYTLRSELYNTDYEDTAGETGNVKGTASTFYDYNYNTNVVGGQVETTLNEYRDVFTNEISEIDNEVRLGAEYTGMPNERLKWAVAYEPTIGFDNRTEVNNRSTVTVTTFEDGDGTNGNADGDDPDDFVERVTTTERSATTETKEFDINNTFKAGVQFFLTEKFRVNAGGEYTDAFIDRTTTTVTAEGIEETVTERSTNGGDFVQTDYSFVTNNSPDPSTTRSANNFPDVDYELGFTYFFGENMFLDAKYAGNGDTDNIFEVGTFSFEVTIQLP